MDAGPACPFTFSYAQGYPCNQDSDCATGRCYFAIPLAGSGSVSGYCTTECLPSDTEDCSNGYLCQAATDRDDNVCALPGPPTLPGNGTLPFGSPCTQDADCAGSGASCGYVDNLDGTIDTFCTSPCDTSSANSCGTCGSCVEPPSGGSDECQPQGGGAIGVTCSRRADCASFDCEGFCTQICSQGGVVTPCPNGSVCQVIITPLEEYGLCVAPSQQGTTATGGPCSFDFECVSGDTCHVPANASSGTCQSGSSLGMACAMDSDCSGGLVCRDVAPGVRTEGQSPAPDTNECTEWCDGGCGAGNSCVALDLDTDLKLFQIPADGGTPVELLDEGEINTEFGDRWSTLTDPLGPGTYTVQVEAYGLAFGNYVIDFTNGLAAEGQTTQVEPNNSFAQAQVIQVPTKVIGAFRAPQELDYYTFTLGSPATMTITTSRGVPSACLPDSQVAQTAWGSACTTDYQCASGICEQALQLCGQYCMQNSDCGGVDPPDGGTDAGWFLPDGGVINMEPVDAGPPLPICASFLTYSSCVEADDWGELPAGAECHYSFECTNGYCATLTGPGLGFCTQTCAGPGANCGIVVNGMSSNMCVQMTVSPSGVPVSDYACVPSAPDGG